MVKISIDSHKLIEDARETIELFGGGIGYTQSILYS